MERYYNTNQTQKLKAGWGQPADAPFDVTHITIQQVYILLGAGSMYTCTIFTTSPAISTDCSINR